MSIDTIELSTKIISDLFKNSLVEFSELEPVAKQTKTTAQLKYLGENRKNVLVVVNYSDAVHIPDKQLSFLTSLLGACKLSLADIAVFNFNRHKAKDFTMFISFFKPTVVFLFGIEPAEFGMPLLFPHFQIQKHKDSAYLFTPSLQEMEQDKSLKTRLWVCLKKIFNL